MTHDLSLAIYVTTIGLFIIWLIAAIQMVMNGEDEVKISNVNQKSILDLITMIFGIGLLLCYIAIIVIVVSILILMIPFAVVGDIWNWIKNKI